MELGANRPLTEMSEMGISIVVKMAGNFAIVLELFVLLLCYLSPLYTFNILHLLIIDMFLEE